MKKLIFILCLVALNGEVGWSQSLSLSWPGGAIPNDTMISIFGYPSDDVIQTPIYVTNKSDSGLNVNVRKTELQVLPGTSNYFCWLQCNFNVYLTIYPVFIPAHTTDTLNFVCHYLPTHVTGSAIIRYSFLVQGNPEDSVCVRVLFDASITGISNNNGNEELLSFPCPNPANNIATFTYSLPEFSNSYPSLSVYSVTGDHVLEVGLTKSAGKATISTSQLPAGVYLVSLNNYGKHLVTRKMVVK